MNNDSFEKMLKDICTKDINIPQKVTNTIRYGLEKENKKWRILEMKKIVISTICFILTITGVAFAGNLMKDFWKGNKGIKTATDYGYIQNIDMEYVKKGNVGIKIESLVLDDSNFGIVFNYKLPINLKNVDNIVLNDLKIKDENNNIIYEDGNIKSLSNRYSAQIYNDKNITKQVILLNNLDHTYPKCTEIEISFSKISLFKNNEKVKTITDNWKFKIDINDKFINRKSIKYEASKNEKIEVIKADLTSTGLDVEMKFNSSVNLEELVRNIRLQNEKGKEFEINQVSAYNENTTPIIKMSFPITIFNVEDNFKMIVKLDKEYIIDLNRMK